VICSVQHCDGVSWEAGMLSGKEIKSLGIIQHPVDSSFRRASYDATIGTIITPDGGETDTFLLPSRGMVEVVSSERLKLPPGIAGYATVKTSLCNEGVLAINIGILDPDYEGFVSSTLINFGRSDRSLKIGDAFLRLTFHRFDNTGISPGNQTVLTGEEYIREKRAKVLQHLSPTFLNFNETVQAVTEEVTASVLEEWKTGMLKYVAIGAVLVALCAFLVNLGVARIGVSKDQVKQEVATQIQDKISRAQITQEVTNQLQLQSKSNQDLDARVKEMESEITRLKALIPTQPGK
jgi:deoxycytidine triphosphate deaminase